jgi:hypothetical protein
LCNLGAVPRSQNLRKAKQPVTTAPVAGEARSFADRICIVVVVAALILGSGLRLYGLQDVPLGLDQDEALDGYDAYSLLKTDRDHHGNFLPIVIQGFNDYRMPLFDYSLVPLVGIFGLKASTVRACAAIWGIVDLATLTALAYLLFGLPAAAAAALLGAFSPWHLPWSRFGVEVTAAMATVNLAMAAFLIWIKNRRSSWIVVSGFFFGLSFYAYAITKLFTPLMILVIGSIHWREFKGSWRAPVLALAVVGVVAMPQAIAILSRNAVASAQFNRSSIFEYIYEIEPKMPGASALRPVSLVAANFAGYFTGAYLLTAGDRGDHWTMPHPRGVGMLLPEQALLIVFALLAFRGRHRKSLLLLAAWLVIAAIPPALTLPLGAVKPDSMIVTDAPPIPESLLPFSALSAVLTPRLLLDHPMSRRNLFACAPWILLAALGFVMLLETTATAPVLRNAAVVVLSVGVAFHATKFVRNYFYEYPAFAAPYFQYGIEQALAAARTLKGPNEFVVITDQVNQPYIYALFYDQYDPLKFQTELVLSEGGVFAQIERFDHYIFYDTRLAYNKLKHGVFIFSEGETPPTNATAMITYPDGDIAYYLVTK